jgi:hypothetical protein
MRTVGTSIYLGIDPTVGRAQFVYAALDEDGKIEALGSGKLNAVLAYAAGQSQAWIAVNGPRGVNQGLTDAANTQQALFNEPGNAAWNNLRLAEAELIARGLESTRTAATPEQCSPWMRTAFELYRQLARLGYQPLTDTSIARGLIEVQANAAFGSLAAASLFEARALEGRLQRQLILNIEGLPLRDPMDFFEEITRHRLLKGVLPFDMVYPTHELNALVAAHTLWLARHQPQRVLTLGDAQEGQLWLPIPEPPEKPERMAYGDD